MDALQENFHRRAAGLPPVPVDRAEWLRAFMADSRKSPTTARSIRGAQRRGGKAAGAVRRHKADKVLRAMRKLQRERPDRSLKTCARLYVMKHDRDWGTMSDQDRDKRIKAVIRQYHRTCTRKNQ